MHFTRKILLGAVALLLPAALVLGVGVTSASASSPITANGTSTCNDITGTLTFSPPLTFKGTGASSETTTIKASETSCSDTSTNLPAGGTLTGSASETVTTSGTNVNVCSSVTKSSPETFTVAWSYKKGKKKLATLTSTKTEFSGYSQVTAGSTGGFQLPNSGGSVLLFSGSFPGSDSGASSNATAYLTVSSYNAIEACVLGGKKSVKKLSLGPSTGASPIAFSG